MPLNALAEFFGERTRPEEVELLASGRGLYLPPDVQAVHDALEASVELVDEFDRDQAEALLARCRTEPS